MKKIFLALSILVFISGNVQMVQAGELNQYEAEVINRARGQFQKDGVKYQADSVYVQELINYLSSDGTDLTAGQRDEAIAEMYANVEQGIKEGYLIPITVQDKEEATKENHVEAAGEDSTVSEENKKNKIAEEDNENETEKESMAGNAINQGSTGRTDIRSAKTKQTADKYNGKIIITDEAGNSLLTLDTAVKNTGFNINRTAVMLIGMGIVLGICSIAAFSCGFLGRGKEHWD